MTRLTSEGIVDFAETTVTSKGQINSPSAMPQTPLRLAPGDRLRLERHAEGRIIMFPCECRRIVDIAKANALIIGDARPDLESLIDEAVGGSHDRAGGSRAQPGSDVTGLDNKVFLRLFVEDDQVALALRTLLSSPSYHFLDRRFVSKALARFETEKFGFTDALIDETNRAAGCTTTFTFDGAAAKTDLFSPIRP